jgi:hypothetical protein
MHHLLFSQVNLSTEEFQKTPLLDHLEGIYTINHFFMPFFLIHTGSKTRQLI